MSERRLTWCSLGSGVVGGALIENIALTDVAARFDLEQKPVAVGGRKGWREGSKDGAIIEPDIRKLPDVDVLFINSPSTPDNEPMLSLIDEQLELERYVVTAEKGTPSNNPRLMLSPFFGYWATYGGGGRLIPKLALDTPDPENIKVLVTVPNATKTYTFGRVSNGENADQVLADAKVLGYAEPDAIGAYNILRAEATSDVPNKHAILWSTLFPDLLPLSPELMQTEFTEDQALRGLNNAGLYRYMVAQVHERDAKKAAALAEKKLGGFLVSHEGWIIIGGLLRVDRTNELGHFKGFSGPNAGYYITFGPHNGRTFDGEASAWGTGAGAAATSGAELDNLKYMRKQQGFGR